MEFKYQNERSYLINSLTPNEAITQLHCKVRWQKNYEINNNPLLPFQVALAAGASWYTIAYHHFCKTILLTILQYLIFVITSHYIYN